MIVNNSTGAFFERSTQNMTALRQQAESLQEELSRGQKLSQSSDNPVAASRLRMLSRAESLSKIDTANSDRAEADLTLADTALSSFASYVTRARELALQAGNETLTDAQRTSIGAELEQIHGGLVALANSRDANGHALFGGETAGDAYTIDGTGNAVYIGTASSGELPLGDGQTVTRSMTGPEFLNFDVNGTPTNLMAVVKTLSDALQGGSVDPAADARDSLAALTTGLDTVNSGQTLIGTRLAWIDLVSERRIDLSELRTSEQTEVGSTDVASTLARLQEITLVLEASQASFAKLSSLSLFDMVR